MIDCRLYKGDIVMIDLPVLEGSIQNGYRPCIIVSNDIANETANVVLVCPITSSQRKKYNPCHIDIQLKKPSIILCEQIMSISKTQIVKKVKNTNEYIVNRLNVGLKHSLNL